MITALHPFFDDSHVGQCVNGGFVHDFREQRFADVVRTAASHEHAPWIQQLDGAQINLFVAGARVRDRRLVLRKGRRVEHDGVEPLAEPLQSAKLPL